MGIEILQCIYEWSSFRYLFINISRSKKYMCRVTKSCVFKLLQNLENSLQNYPENPGNCVSGIPDFKIIPGEHAPGPPWVPRAPRREIVPPPTSMPWHRHCTQTRLNLIRECALCGIKGINCGYVTFVCYVLVIQPLFCNDKNAFNDKLLMIKTVAFFIHSPFPWMAWNLP